MKNNKSGAKSSYEDVMKGFTAYDDCEECFQLDGTDFESAMRSTKKGFYFEVDLVVLLANQIEATVSSVIIPI